ncbi:Nuclease A inhibitor-like protein [Abditibacterium utsteinense]|uniref:Nuclease A inhibitor-like protein n=1 Tax=Abditibacterium utsteinense TaxID=1960156 RepID=A0A2S8SSS2_9BACT|nr:nuclease A inhibitor family protein [Abditibacterium utsteinense]PQV63864.1 Nuclease A inhibitor-like protein [Abditibacterium utsteinense]
MKNAFRVATTALCFSLCLCALSSGAQAATETPAVAPEAPSEVAPEAPPEVAPEAPPETSIETVMIEKPAIVLALEAAIDGLQMPSETDAPFQIVFFEIAADELAAAPQKMTPAQLAKLAGAPEDAEIEMRDLDAFFKVATTEEEWMNEEEKATVARFAALLQTLKTELKDAQIVVWGDAEKQVAIIGGCDGGAAGVTTFVVET